MWCVYVVHISINIIKAIIQIINIIKAVIQITKTNNRKTETLMNIKKIFQCNHYTMNTVYFYKCELADLNVYHLLALNQSKIVMVTFSCVT